jgi:hypothetical protein
LPPKTEQRIVLPELAGITEDPSEWTDQPGLEWKRGLAILGRFVFVLGIRFPSA